MRSRSITCAVAVLVTSAPIARAQAPTDPSVAVKRAIAKSKAGDHVAAIELYKVAYDLKPNPLLHSNIGSEFMQLGRHGEALTYFCRYLTEDPGGRLVDYATAQAKVAHDKLGRDPDVDPCAPPAQPARPVKPVVVVEPAPEPASPQRREAPSAPGAPGRGLRLTGVSLGVLGLVAVGTGTAFGVLAQRDNDLIENHDPKDPWPDDVRDIQLRGQRYENYQIALTAAGGALVVGGVVLYLVGRAQRGSATPTTAAIVTPSGVAIRGSF